MLLSVSAVVDGLSSDIHQHTDTAGLPSWRIRYVRFMSDRQTLGNDRMNVALGRAGWLLSSL